MDPVRFTVVLVVGLTGVVIAQESQSSARATALVQRLTEKHMDAAAAVDPQNPNRIFAAFYVPPSQLLVVGATRADAGLLSARIREGKYRDVYMDLQTAPVTNGKLFVHDIGADGLNRSGKSIVDNVYENGVRMELMKNGSASDRLASVDVEYARMLRALVSALDQPPVQPDLSSPTAVPVSQLRR